MQLIGRLVIEASNHSLFLNYKENSQSYLLEVSLILPRTIDFSKRSKEIKIRKLLAGEKRRKWRKASIGSNSRHDLNFACRWKELIASPQLCIALLIIHSSWRNRTSTTSLRFLFSFETSSTKSRNIYPRALILPRKGSSFNSVEIFTATIPSMNRDRRRISSLYYAKT